MRALASNLARGASPVTENTGCWLLKLRLETARGAFQFTSIFISLESGTPMDRIELISCGWNAFRMASLAICSACMHVVLPAPLGPMIKVVWLKGRVASLKTLKL